MSKVVIKVADLGKQYRLGNVSAGTLSYDLNRWWYRMRGKEDPYIKLGEMNDREVKSSSDLIWALKDVNFEVNEGEVIGVIGKNGAGKSTLLKILSQVTAPTIGNVKIKGRIASLLEVGTGFHPDLTGRENIFLNGAILGMTRKEIRAKFDDIVDFSGVERYIDTPVKRYSSGMYVRLAFAVAAHLDPEILIVDEVLSVGDAEFQKKCLGKMKEVSGKGRTVLFVSHNLLSIKTLCDRGVFLEKGSVSAIGGIGEVLSLYKGSLTANFNINAETKLSERANRCASGGRYAGALRFSSLKFLDHNNVEATVFDNASSFYLEIKYEVFEDIPDLAIAVRFESADTFDVITSNFHIINKQSVKKGVKSGLLIRFFNIPFNPGDYIPYIWAGSIDKQPYDVIDRLITSVPVIEIIGNMGQNNYIEVPAELKIM